MDQGSVTHGVTTSLQNLQQFKPPWVYKTQLEIDLVNEINVLSNKSDLSVAGKNKILILQYKLDDVHIKNGEWCLY